MLPPGAGRGGGGGDHDLPPTRSPFTTKSWRAAKAAARLSRSPELRELVSTVEEIYGLAQAGKITPSLGVVVGDLIQRAGDELKRGHTGNALHLIRAARRLAED